jgi:hypothetical protein
VQTCRALASFENSHSKRAAQSLHSRTVIANVPRNRFIREQSEQTCRAVASLENSQQALCGGIRDGDGSLRSRCNYRLLVIFEEVACPGTINETTCSMVESRNETTSL